MISNELKNDIVSRLSSLNVEKIILFGSHAHGNNSTDSDIDLYVVTKDNFTPRSYAEKRHLVRAISKKLGDIRENYEIDLLVHTMQMYQQFKSLQSAFSKDLLNKGISLH
jgi:uncharacterized protein